MARPVATPRSTIPSQGWQELPKGLTQKGSGKGVADRNVHDGSQNTPQPTCSPYSAPLSLLRGEICGPVTMVEMALRVTPKARLEKTAQLLSGELQLPYTLEASPPTPSPC